MPIKPKIEEAFEGPDIVVLCEDEMAISLVTNFQKIYLKRWHPKIEVSNTKKNKSIHGFLSIKVGQEHRFIKD
jgi:hypothetical protein